ncbi:MAG: prepilin peptidase [Candidatus Woesearchaeota archaeon]
MGTIETIFPIWLLFIISGLALLVATYVDIKKREVPDSLTYILISIGIFMAILSSIFSFSWIPLIASLTGLFIAYCIGAVFYYGGQWGGGDAKMLMGLGALWGVHILPFFNGLALTWSTIPLLLVFVISILFAGLLYGMLLLATKIIINFSTFKKALYKKTHEPLLRKTQLLIVLLTFIFLVVGLLSYVTTIKLFFLSLAILIILSYYFLLWAKVAEETLLIGHLSVDKATPGEWVAKPVFIPTKKHSLVDQIKLYWSMQYQGKEFHHQKTKNQFINNQTKKSIRLLVFETYGGSVIFWSWMRQLYLMCYKKARQQFRKKIIYALHISSEKKFKEYCKAKKIFSLPEIVMRHNLFFDKLLLCSKQSEGLTKQQINILKKNNIQTISVKKGIPFMPAFLIGFVITVVFYMCYVV